MLVSGDLEAKLKKRRLEKIVEKGFKARDENLENSSIEMGGTHKSSPSHYFQSSI